MPLRLLNCRGENPPKPKVYTITQPDSANPVWAVFSTYVWKTFYNAVCLSARGMALYCRLRQLTPALKPMAALIGVPPAVAGAAGAPEDFRVYGSDSSGPALGGWGAPSSQRFSVNFSVDGTVQSADDENATVKIEAVNGQPVDESAAQEATEDSGAPPGSAAAMRPGLASSAAQGGLGTGLG